MALAQVEVLIVVRAVVLEVAAVAFKIRPPLIQVQQIIRQALIAPAHKIVIVLLIVAAAIVAVLHLKVLQIITIKTVEALIVKVEVVHQTQN